MLGTVRLFKLIDEHLSARQLILHHVSIGVYTHIYLFIYPSHFNYMGINGEGHTLVLYVRDILEPESAVGSCFVDVAE